MRGGNVKAMSLRSLITSLLGCLVGLVGSVFLAEHARRLIARTRHPSMLSMDQLSWRAGELEALGETRALAAFDTEMRRRLESSALLSDWRG